MLSAEPSLVTSQLQRVTEPRVILLLKCCAEALVFLASAEGLAFHVNIVNKRNPVHQWEGAKGGGRVGVQV